MLILLSPAKTFNDKIPVPGKFPVREPEFYENYSAILLEQLRLHTPESLADLLDVSEKIAQLNFQRYQGWQTAINETNAKPAAFSFWGDVNKHFDAFTLEKADLKYADEHVVYLSGLFGAVRPLDFIQEYRLEMGKSLVVNPRCTNLYQFWAKPLVEYFNKRIAAEKVNFILNLASKEYAAAVDLKKLNCPVIAVQFKDEKNGVYKVIGVNAKRARGAFARWAIQERITKVDELKAFNVDGYEFYPDESSETLLTFRRPEKK